MSVSRPLSKKVLKRMFLKVLYEHRPGGCYENHGRDYTGIVRHKIVEYFGIPPLSKDEYAEGLRAVFELERDGYIMQDPTQSSERFKVITGKAERVAQQSLEDMQLPSVDLDQVLTRDDLRDKIHDDFLGGDYEIAIFKAFKFLEERVRAKANLSAREIGADLMSRAFRPSGGILRHSDAQTPGEEEGLHLLMRGAILWFKNPGSHRTVGYDNAEHAAQALAFSNLLIDTVQQCEKR